jgi:hypothetical protein
MIIDTQNIGVIKNSANRPNADKIRIYNKHIHFLSYKKFLPKKGYAYDNIFYDNILS